MLDLESKIEAIPEEEEKEKPLEEIIKSLDEA